ncbi:hypothetical protein AGABI1DRAFT_131244 [Agaricus bisporus var. burnettii JB137-S8]|uniref:Uncharacterized protein n=1 Tax=Agaricus bisporus var. burnettii (strain JB137-S8 / ATCC MYA-4627 / FGSC 10392) TaxID=597362 RepID=K5WM68_AGABU|nr:uncharacterized protein AGABI1DRAFT_131244 [Agaricus bisporus var. burnettii JB137-S8]EKM76416.1 hypothetical protein AGABI1DRAFT_131244 [Agaricus bisporus var. burnettii JB137-S8]
MRILFEMANLPKDSCSPCQYTLRISPVCLTRHPRPRLNCAQTAASRISSRRQIALRDRNAFDDTMTANNFIYSEADFEDVKVTLSGSTTTSSFRLPSTTLISFSGRSGFQATSDPIAFDDDRLSPDDPHDLAHLKQPSEMDLRTAIDALLRQAFDSRHRKYGGKSSQVVYRIVSSGSAPRGIAKADAVVWSPIPSGFNYLIWGLPNAHVFCAESRRRHDSLATFVFEAKFQDKEAAVRQLVLIYVLHSTSAARWDLKATRFNGALLVGSNITLYSSKWTQKHVYTIIFDLWVFSNLLELFVFLCQLADNIHNRVREMGDELEKYEVGFTRRITDAVQEP